MIVIKPCDTNPLLRWWWWWTICCATTELSSVLTGVVSLFPLFLFSSLHGIKLFIDKKWLLIMRCRRLLRRKLAPQHVTRLIGPLNNIQWITGKIQFAVLSFVFPLKLIFRADAWWLVFRIRLTPNSLDLWHFGFLWIIAAVSGRCWPGIGGPHVCGHVLINYVKEHN